MFKSMKEQDGYGVVQTRYYLTRGDSCKITATPQKNGESIADRVDKCVFKLATSNYAMLQTTLNGTKIFPIDMKINENRDGFVLNLSSDITKEIPVGSYIYEIEYTLSDGSVQTPHSWKFDIVKEIE